MSATDLIEYISKRSSIKVNPVQIGKELKFLGYDRFAKKITGFTKYGYYVDFIEGF